MKPFQFLEFTILQHINVFRVGTDGVLLGAFCNVTEAESVLEVGTGTGLISLMIAQRNPSAKISAIDINEEAVSLAKENFRNSSFADRLKVELLDFKNFEAQRKYDLVVCNPPFFEKNNSEKDSLARQQRELNFRNLIEKSSEIITENGVVSVIIPAESAIEIERLAKGFHLYLTKKINIYGIKGGNLKRNILEFSYVQKPLEIISFTIEKSPRKYSEQYLELTKKFHIFNR